MGEQTTSIPIVEVYFRNPKRLVNFELPSTSTNICSLFVIRYALMLDCWKGAPDERPSFEQLVSTLETMMTAGTPYYDFDKLDETNACSVRHNPTATSESVFGIDAVTR